MNAAFKVGFPESPAPHIPLDAANVQHEPVRATSINGVISKRRLEGCHSLKGGCIGNTSTNNNPKTDVAMKTAISVLIGFLLTGLAGLTLLIFVLANTSVSRTADGQATSFEFSFGGSSSPVSNTYRTKTAGSTHLGRQINAGEHTIYYAENISADEADQLVQFLADNPDWLTAPHCFHLERSGHQLNFTFVVDSMCVGFEEAENILREVERSMEDIAFYGSDIVAGICDCNLVTVVSIDERNPTRRNEMTLCDYVDTGVLRIYRDHEAVTGKQADALADFFDRNPRYFAEGESWTLQLDRCDNNLVLRILLPHEGWLVPEHLTIAESIERRLELETFEGENLVIELCDNLAIPQKSVDSTRPAVLNTYEAM